MFVLQADSVQLKALLNVLRCVAKGEEVSAVVGSVQSPSTSGMRALQTSMVITARKDYPLTTNFPAHLRSLMVCEKHGWETSYQKYSFKMFFFLLRSFIVTGFSSGSALRHFAEKIEMSERTTSKSAQCPKVLLSNRPSFVRFSL
jgi:hypothetical protein